VRSQLENRQDGFSVEHLVSFPAFFDEQIRGKHPAAALANEHIDVHDFACLEIHPIAGLNVSARGGLALRLGRLPVYGRRRVSLQLLSSTFLPLMATLHTSSP